MNIQTLLENRAKAWESAKAFLDNAKRDESGNISAEDLATYQKMEDDIASLGKQVDAYNRQKELEASILKPMEGGKPKEAKIGTASEKYNEAFWKNMRARFDQVVYNELAEGTDTAGGYLVPDEFEKRLIDALQEQNIFRSLATKITTASGDRKIPVVTTHGEAAWVDEAALIPASDEAFSQVSLSAFKLATRIKASWELVQDSFFDLEGYIAQEFTRRIGVAEEQAFISGTGTGQPTGILSSAQLGVTAASATAVTADELIDLVYSLRAPYRSRSSFLTNDSTIRFLRKLKDSSGQYLWQPALTAGNPDRFLGYVINTSPAMPGVATGNKTVLFGDYTFYWIADRKGKTFQRLNELYAENGQVGWIAWERVDGKLILPEAVKYLVQA